MEKQLHPYHFLYKESTDDFYAKGVTLKAESAIKGLRNFSILYPDAIFISMSKVNEEGELDNGKKDMLQV